LADVLHIAFHTFSADPDIPANFTGPCFQTQEIRSHTSRQLFFAAVSNQRSNPQHPLENSAKDQSGSSYLFHWPR
jgi:hypothetical protein